MNSQVNYSLPISAFVVGLNEEALLRDCLLSLSFCDEILYLDLGSTDDSVSVAKACGAVVHEVLRRPAVEAVIAENIHLVRNRWVLFLDPDETLQRNLSEFICEEFARVSADESIAAVSVPWQFFFKKRRLTGTPWGGVNSKTIMFDTQRCTFVSEVHRGKILENGFKQLSIPPGEDNTLNHFWITSWGGAISKHLRYTKLEREIRNSKWKPKLAIQIGLEWPKRFVESFILTKGYRDGHIGFLLSILWATYHTLILFPPSSRRF